MDIRVERLKIAFNWLRHNRGLRSQKELAKRLSVDENTISRAMTGKVPPSDNLLLQLNECFGNPFNFRWLCGDLAPQFNDAPSQPVQKVPDIIDLCSRLVSEVEELRKDVRKQFDEVAEMRNSLRDERKAMTQLIQQLAALAQPQKGYTYQPPKKPQNIADQQ